DCVDMIDELKRRRVSLHICNMGGDAVDLSSQINVFILQILAAFAELERSMISDRTREAKQELKRQGRVAGGIPLGFMSREVIDQAHKEQTGQTRKIKILVTNPKEREAMKTLLVWRLQGFTLEQIRWKAREAGVTNRAGGGFSEMHVRKYCLTEAKLQLTEMVV